MLLKSKPYKSKKYLKFICGHQDIATFSGGLEDIVPHHENWMFPNHGVGQKCNDTQAVPLSAGNHAERHRVGPVEFWGTIRPQEEMVRLISAFIDETYNVDPEVLIVGLLTDWLKEQR